MARFATLALCRTRLLLLWRVTWPREMCAVVLLCLLRSKLLVLHVYVYDSHAPHYALFD